MNPSSLAESSMKALFKLKIFLRPYVWLIVASGLLAIPLAVLRSSLPLFIKYFTDVVLPHPSLKRLLIFSGGIVAMYVANFIVRFPHYFLLRVVVIRTNQKMKNRLFEHLMGLSADYFTEQSTGNLISRVAMDPLYVVAGLSCINVILREPLTLVVLLGYALHLNWKLTLVTFGIVPPLAWVFHASGRNLKRYMSRLTEENASLYSTLQESFSGVRVIKTFRLERYVKKKFRDKNERVAKLLLKTSMLEEAAHPLVELLGAFAMAAMILFGGLQILDHRMTGGDLMAFFTSFLLMMNPLRQLNDVNMKLHQAAAATERIFEVLEWKPKLHLPEEPVSVSEIRKEIRLENVSFAYPDSPERLVLKDVSFAIPKGGVAALVGPSGAGKSSLISLLPRIYDVVEGKILLDSRDIREIKLDDLRKMIAVVSQDVFLFNDSIEENIRCGRLWATHEEIHEAARKAHALEFIEALPEGFRTVIGDRGQKLSGGERQRISIARAFLREAPILILDEATSSLDTKSERAVQKALDELMVNRTTLIIAHRLSTIRHADQILVLKEGQIVERGRHDELIELGGEYARFHEVSRV